MQENTSLAPKESFEKFINSNKTAEILESAKPFIELIMHNECALREIETKLNVLNDEFSTLYNHNPIETIKTRVKDPISIVEKIDDKLMDMGKDSSGSGVGTGGMAAKIVAAQIANYSGADIVITNGNDVLNIHRIIAGEDVGTLFLQHENRDIDVLSLV